jgi:hypothetical protein
LPEPRLDGKCVYCEKDAVTRDGRFCTRHLRQLIRKLTPGNVKQTGLGRDVEHKQAYDEDNPSTENNVRILEGD